jgi:transposase
VATIVLTREQHTRLARASRAPSTPQRLARRSAIVLMAADGDSVSAIAARLGVSAPTVRLWIRRFREGGVDGIMHDAAGRGRPPAVDGPALLLAVAATATSGSTRSRSIRALARDLGVSASSVWRALKKTQATAGSATARIQPKRQ